MGKLAYGIFYKDARTKEAHHPYQFFWFCCVKSARAVVPFEEYAVRRLDVVRPRVSREVRPVDSTNNGRLDGEMIMG